jgi:phosphatidylglycerophosphatase A
LQNPINQSPTEKKVWATVVELVCTFFYLGKFPKAPGTIGTLGAIPLVYVFGLGGDFIYLVATMVLVIVSIFLCEHYEKIFNVHDSGQVVIDEVAGFLITMALIPFTAQSVIIGFLLFRLLDVSKPSLIGVLDKKVKGGLGVMADDILAGLIANIVLQILYIKTNWLGVQLTIEAGKIW